MRFHYPELCSTGFALFGKPIPPPFQHILGNTLHFQLRNINRTILSNETAFQSKTVGEGRFVAFPFISILGLSERIVIPRYHTNSSLLESSVPFRSRFFSGFRFFVLVCKFMEYCQFYYLLFLGCTVVLDGWLSRFLLFSYCSLRMSHFLEIDRDIIQYPRLWALST